MSDASDLARTYVHEDLEKFLRLVWVQLRKRLPEFCAMPTGRARRLRIGEKDSAPQRIQSLRGEVYNLYNNTTRPYASTSDTRTREVTLDQSRQWLSQLQELAAFGVSSVCQLSNTEWKPLGEVVTDALRMQSGLPRIVHGFVHFKNDNISRSATYRVYLNVTADAHLSVLRYIVEECMQNKPEFVVGGPPVTSPLREAVEREEAIEREGARGIKSCKVAGLRALGVRAEGIVIYCTTKTSAEWISGEIAEKTPMNYFSHGTPKLTKRVAPGIAIAAEPEQQSTGLSDSRQSFGKIRSELTALALVEAYANGRANATLDDYYYFVGRVAVAFHGHGLNPLKPWA